MSTFWSAFIIVIVVAHIVGYVWLLLATSKMPAGSKVGETTGHVFDDDLEEYNNPLPRWWLYLFYITIVFGIGYFVLYPALGNFKGYLGWSQMTEHANEVAAAEAKYGPLYKKMASVPLAQLAEDPEAMQTGKRLFGNNCAVCHGESGTGAIGFPNLTDNDWLYGGDPEVIKASIMDGRTGAMPAWGPVLGEQGVEEVAAYVYSLNGRKAPAQLVEAGAAKFAATCASCHGADGKGMQAMGAPDLTDNVWLYGGSLTSIKESIRNGRQGTMPAHKDILGEDRVHIVAAYVYSLSAKKGHVSGEKSR